MTATQIGRHILETRLVKFLKRAKTKYDSGRDPALKMFKCSYFLAASLLFMILVARMVSVVVCVRFQSPPNLNILSWNVHAKPFVQTILMIIAWFNETKWKMKRESENKGLSKFTVARNCKNTISVKYNCTTYCSCKYSGTMTMSRKFPSQAAGRAQDKHLTRIGARGVVAQSHTFGLFRRLLPCFCDTLVLALHIRTIDMLVAHYPRICRPFWEWYVVCSKVRTGDVLKFATLHQCHQANSH